MTLTRDPTRLPRSRLLQATARWDAGERSTVHAVAISPAAERVVLGVDRELLLWEGDEVRSLAHLGACSIAFSPDGSRLLTGEPPDGCLVRLWDLEGRELLRLDKHRRAVTFVAFLPGGAQALSGGLDRTLRLWDLEKAKTLRILKHTQCDEVRDAAVSPDGRRAVATAGAALAFWDLEERQLRRLKRYPAPHRAIPEGPPPTPSPQAPSPEVQEQVKEWLRSKPDLPASVAYLPDGERVLWGSEEGFVSLVDESGERLATVGRHAERVHAVAPVANERAVSVARGDAALRLWDLDRGEELDRLELPGATRDDRSLAVVEGGRWLVIAWKHTVLRVDVSEHPPSS